MIVIDICYIALFLVAPAGVLWLCRRFSVPGKVGPILILYMLGLIVGNLGWRPAGLAGIQDVLSSAMVPLAIPLMLFSCSYNTKELKSQMLVLLTGLCSVVAAVVGGYFIFGCHIDGGAKIGAMLTGVYTGGTVNLASLKTMLGVPEETFVLLNSYDMVVSFLYLVLLMSFGVRILRRFLPCRTLQQGEFAEIADGAGETASRNANPYAGLLSRGGLKDAGVQLAFAALIIVVSGGVGLLCGDGAFMTVFMLLLTTLSIAASFLKCLKGRKYGYDIGMYCIYVFSMVVASMADFSSMDISGELYTIAYLTTVIFASFLLQVLFAKILRLDADTVAISSVAFICSPPFVPMVAGAMKNRNVLAAGLAIGVFGYAAGTYLGFIIFRLLSL